MKEDHSKDEMIIPTFPDLKKIKDIVFGEI